MYVQVITQFYYDKIFICSYFLWHLQHCFQSLTRSRYIKAKIARQYLIAHRTSVPSERVFSTAEDIVSWPPVLQYVSYREVPVSFHPYYQVSQTSIKRFYFKGWLCVPIHTCINILSATPPPPFLHLNKFIKKFIKTLKALQSFM